ncbi:MAG TPA: decaprenyl-phosphate phosphoribosyltransferase, partial [Firmicutes bacterium]|nr:decaprenyl-phosphate phosphoribosyltransferase [Bacillota bacterium]
MMRTLSALFRLMRPHQWLKNVFVFAGLAFGERVTSTGELQHVLSIADPIDILRSTLIAFIAFCLVSGAVYVFNDLKDVEQDRIHPLKRNRPLAAGEVSPVFAAIFGIALLAGGLVLAYWL